MILDLNNEADTLALGKRLAQVLRQGGVIYLHGDLGAGKTTLSRGIIQALGHSGAVKSPTYTLVEPYQLGELTVFHFDLYRLEDPEELEYIGIREYFHGDAICLVEWPQRGGAGIPPADLNINLIMVGKARRAELGFGTARGQSLLGELTKI